MIGYRILFRLECCIGLIRLFLVSWTWKKFNLPFGYILKPNLLYLRGELSVGTRFRLHKGARIEIGSSGRLTIGKNVAIGHNFHCIAHSEVRIDDGCLLSSNIYIGDVSHHRTQGKSPNDTDLVLDSVCLGRNVFIGHGVTILPGVKLGDDVVVGAGSVVTKSFVSGSVIAGVPAKIMEK